MIEDPIVEEMRRFRREHAARHDNDLDQICKALREREARSKRKLVNRGSRVFLPKTGSES